ncbi:MULTISPECIES: methionyl-tRNA formyltransferase [Weeksella]|uniref:methionyl-tRNA formyltransferase n=1 Tax=Weeksella TaxID=1013 RepID=UPI0008A4D46F|nr:MULTISPECIES: methionyl-tRNA formyltransferase [Weeksella]MDK7374546.1 methionyl-tRNA formyltransferase [Weeksella virosa]OFM83132.1 methionyl-tRNA formyltransferase [Weeksella sp. HMSC059D05]
MRVVFMGTPEFAKASLQEIHENSLHEIVGVVTVPDKPAGRGQKIQQSAVKQYAEEKKLPLLQPEKLRDKNFIEALKKLDADVFVVVAFRMLPQVVWSIPPKGTFNLHGSLLPQYRGAAPINWAIINGEKETGVTTFLIDEKIDTGKILLTDKVAIGVDDNVGKIHDELMNLGKKLVVETLDALEKDSITSYPQPLEKELHHAPKLYKDDCRIDWSWKLEKIHNHVRGLSPYPAAWTMINGKSAKILAGKIAQDFPEDLSKNVLHLTKNNLFVRVENGVYEILEIQPQGKRKMSAKDFINGNQNVSWLALDD